MNKKKKLIEKLIFYSTFSIFFLIGLISFRDYGISLDEHYQRETGLLYYEIIKGFFFELEDLKKIDLSTINEIVLGNKDNIVNIYPNQLIQPILFDLPIELLIDLFNVERSDQIYHLRHFINFLYFFISIYLFFKILRKRFSENIYAYIGMLMLFLSPRIFGESFYNYKDIFFLSLTVINTYTAINLINKPGLKSSILFSVTSALAFDARVLALLFITITYFIILIKSSEKKDYFKKNYKYFSLSILLFPIFTIAFWPYLWTGALDNLIYYFQNIPKTPILNFYFGDYFYPQDTPWHYNFVWILITSPITITIFFILGLFKILSRNTKRVFEIEFKNLWNGNKEMQDSMFLYILLIIFLSLFIFDYNFDSWRHLYFIYPFIISIALSGIYFLNIMFRKKIFKAAVFSIVFFEIFYLGYWNFKNHPYQYVFFNPIFKNYSKNNFDLDYWGMSNKDAIEYILENDNRELIKISRISFTSLENSLLIMQKDKADRVRIINDLENSDYVTNNYRKKSWGKIKNIDLLNAKFIKVHDIVVDNVIINTIYKKMN